MSSDISEVVLDAYAATEIKCDYGIMRLPLTLNNLKIVSAILSRSDCIVLENRHLFAKKYMGS